jgi:hypothetical protein
MPFSALSVSDMPGWPIGGGECGRLIRRCDWSATPLGPMEDWSPVLRFTVQTLLNSPVPQVLLWGRTGIMLYNDGYAAIADDRHPGALGGDVRTIWPETWDWNSAVLTRGFAGEVVGHRDQMFVGPVLHAHPRRTRCGGRRALHRHRQHRAAGRGKATRAQPDGGAIDR